MAMSRLLAKNLGKAKPAQAKVISEFEGKASPVAKQTRSGASGRRRKGKKQNGG